MTDRKWNPIVGPCTFVYKNGKRCNGTLEIVAYATGTTRETKHRYVILACSKKNGHGLEPFKSDAHCELFGFTDDELIAAHDLEYWESIGERWKS